MIRATIALTLVLVLAVGCEANGPRVQNVHPGGAVPLDQLVPACRAPSSVEYAACMKAAQILEESPEDATETYLANWNHVAFEGKHRVARGGPLRESSGGGGGGGGGGFGNCGGGNSCNFGGGGGGDEGEAIVLLVLIGVVLVAVAAVAAYDAARDARIAAAQKITTRALREVYQRSGSPYSQAMLAETASLRFKSEGDFDRIAITHEGLTTNGPNP